ncbi:hypothetical protein HMPREF9997_01079 [Corynebacterium durum F0235]|uniref:Uncharacterized protein n=1 Tax=Corynebacterium durum F0235 TaxID=1035195 RepID=L1MI08_9CORY|nr:hypothetical protein HMPREF9997_01079 [Corynebacterium durum F0235]
MVWVLCQICVNQSPFIQRCGCICGRDERKTHIVTSNTVAWCRVGFSVFPHWFFA